MIRTVITTFKDSRNLSIASLDITNGEVQIDTVNPLNVSTLVRLQEELNEGYFYSDYKVVERSSTFELEHSCGSISAGAGLARIAKLQEKPSFIGLLRMMILNGAKFLTSKSSDVVEDYGAVNVMNLSTTDNLGINLTHLVPAFLEENDDKAWRFTTDNLLRTDHLDQYNDISGLRFLCGLVDFGEYTDYIKNEGTVTLKTESGQHYEYNCYSVSKELPLFSLRPNVMTSSHMVGVLQYLSEAYKCALKTLTEGLFEDKKTITYEGTGGGSLVAGRYLKLKSNAKTDKKTISDMSSHLFSSLSQSNSVIATQDDFAKIHPHYPLYKSIVVSEVRNFIGSNLSKDQKFEAYKRVKSTETLINLALLESKWQIMFDDNGSLFDLWLKSKEMKINIPYYTVTISGGGGSWRPNAYY
jgi:hypothetical protein